MMVVSLRRGDYRPGQIEVQSDCEYACQLFCAFPENSDLYTIQPCCFASVDLIKDLSRPLRARSVSPLGWWGLSRMAWLLLLNCA
jgi:hypothetical protein